MGLSDTAVHALWAVVLLTAGGALGAAVWQEADETREAREAFAERGERRFHAGAAPVDGVLDAAADTVRFQLVNTGRVLLDPEEVTVVFDGVPRSLAAVESAGTSGSRVWPPETHANLTVGAEWEPRRAVVVGPFGVLAFWNNTEAPYFAEIGVEPDPAQVEFLATQQFTAVGLDQYGHSFSSNAVTWSTDVLGASIDSNGVFTAGTTADCGLVTATDSGVSGAADVCVYRNPPVLTTMTVSPNPASVEYTKTQQFTAQGYDQYGLPMAVTPTWSTDVSGSSIDANGLFTAGTTTASGTVTATQGGVTATAAVDVYRNPAVLTSAVVTPDPASVEFQKTQQFTAQGYDQYGLPMSATFAWSTTVSGSSVDTNGLFTAGTTVASGAVTATSGGVSDAASVSVYRNAAVVTTVAVSPSSANVEFTKTQQFTAQAYDQYGLAMSASFAWSTNVAGSSVDANGLFTAGTTEASGSVTATASGVSGSASVTVYRNAAVLTTLVVSPDPANVQATKSRTFTAQGYDQYGLAMATSPSWSTNVAGASIGSGTGAFTAGTTIGCGTVTATQGSVSDTASVCVVRLEVKVNWIKLYKGGTEQYSFRTTDTVTSKAEIVAVSDGAVVSGLSVTLVTKNPSASVVDTDTATTDASGVAQGSYRPGSGAPTGTYTLEVSGVSASWITYRSDLNVETVQAYSVT